MAIDQHARSRCQPPADVGPHQLADALRVGHGVIARALQLGLLPAPDRDGRWSAAAVEDLRARWPQIAAAVVAARELGAAQCAALLAQATGLPVERADVEELARRGMLTTSRSYKNWPLYRVRDVQALAASPQAREQLAAMADGRSR